MKVFWITIWILTCLLFLFWSYFVHLWEWWGESGIDGGGRGSLKASWRHNVRDDVSNHHGLDCLLDRLFRRRSKKASLAFVKGIHRWPVISRHEGPVTRKMFVTSTCDGEVKSWKSNYIPYVVDVITSSCLDPMQLQWRHNGRESVSNQQPYDCLLNSLFKRRSQKTSKLRVTGLCAGTSPDR